MSWILTDVRGPSIQVYELRDESWFDRGTGICRGMINADGHAVILVEAESPQVQGNEDEPGGFLTKDILLNSNVERDDIYGKQQGMFPPRQTTRPSLTIYLVDTLIVWTDPESKLDIALSFQDADGCEDTWQFICEVQKHLISVGTPFSTLGKYVAVANLYPLAVERG